MGNELLELLYFIASSQNEDAEIFDLNKEALQASRMKEGTSESALVSIRPVALYDDSIFMEVFKSLEYACTNEAETHFVRVS
jgi:hypothetical protein